MQKKSDFDDIEMSYLQKIRMDSKEYKRLYEKGLELIEKEPDSQKLLTTILDDYLKRLDDLPPMEISLEKINSYDESLQEKIKSLILFGTQAVLIRENSKIHKNLKETNQKYRDLLSVVTHEFKNSLTSIYGYNRIIKKRLEQKRYDNLLSLTENIDRLTKNLFAMVDTLLNMFLIEEGKLRLERQLFDIVEDVINPLVDELAAPLQHRKQEVVIKKEGDKNIFYGDLHLMHVVFRNLFLNALQYGKEETNIEISIFSKDKTLEIHFLNYGEGLKPEQIPHIFEKFSRFHQSKGRSNVGLGLYTVKNIIEMHGGKIKAESEPSEWMKFIVSLPNKY
ncbi:MAG: HAMP domain-containing histidine kinase [Calditrichaeota bacterium]|nr:HAMP domain-containing histidine kinase [Calditrichota bacterium]